MKKSGVPGSEFDYRRKRILVDTHCEETAISYFAVTNRTVAPPPRRPEDRKTFQVLTTARNFRDNRVRTVRELAFILFHLFSPTFSS